MTPLSKTPKWSWRKPGLKLGLIGVPDTTPIADNLEVLFVIGNQ